MLFMTILTLLLVAGCVSMVWPSLRGLRPEEGDPRQVDTTPAASVAAGPARLESLEGVLVAQLAAGEITRRQYLRAMEKVAACDDERHPWTVPPETGSEAEH